MLSPRHFLFVCEKVEKVIRLGCEEEARKAAVAIVDDWASEVIAAHINTKRFPWSVRAEFEVAGRNIQPLGVDFGRDQRPEVNKWVLECSGLLRERWHYWAETSERFTACQKLRRQS